MTTASDHRRIVRRSSGTVMAGTAVIGGTLFLFQIMVARIADPALFGALLALLGVLLVFEAPANMIEATVASAVAGREAPPDGRPDGRAIATGPLIADTLVGGLLICVCLLAAAVPLSHYLHLGATNTALLVAVYAIPIAVGVVPKGLLAGFGYYKALWIGLAAGAVVRLALGIVLVHSGWGLRGAMGAWVAGEAVTAAVLLVALRIHVGSSQPRPDGHQSFRWGDVTGSGIAFTGFWVLTSIDVIVARHYLSSTAAGLYGAAATLAQLTMVFCGALGAVLVLHLLRARQEGNTSRFGLFLGLTVVASLAVGATALLGVYASSLLHIVFESAYVPATPVVGLLALAGAALGIITVLVYYLLAQGARLPAASSWLGVLCVIAAVGAQHESIQAVATVMLVATTAVAALMSVVAAHSRRYQRQPGTELSRLSNTGPAVDLTIVVPYYNPGPLLRANLEQLIAVLGSMDVSFEIVAVSDGCTDGSELSIADLADERILRVSLPLNQGKGAALRTGLNSGRGRYLGFIDADGDLDPRLLEPFVTLIRLYQPDIVMGSKRHPLSEVAYPPLRRVYSVGYQLLIRILFRLNVRDTQTGLKLVSRDALAAVLPRLLEKRFAFDLELLVVARRLGYRRVLEAPVRVRHQFSSTVSFRSVRHTLVDTLAIFYRSRILQYYDRPPSEMPAGHGLQPASTTLRGLAAYQF
jgi:O-antigen/teichoic acid export membrane protein